MKNILQHILGNYYDLQLVSGKCNSIELTCNMTKIVMKRMITQRQARTATPVIKLKGFTICQVDTGCAESRSASTSIFLLPSCKLHSEMNKLLLWKLVWIIGNVIFRQRLPGYAFIVVTECMYVGILAGFARGYYVRSFGLCN